MSKSSYLINYLEAGVSKSANGFISVVHSHGNTARLEVVQLVDNRFGSIGRREGDVNFAGLWNYKVGGFVLVAERVTADDNGLGPAGNETRDGLAEDRLAENGTAQDVTDGAVRAWPHLLQLELCNQNN